MKSFFTILILVASTIWTAANAQSFCGTRTHYSNTLANYQTTAKRLGTNGTSAYSDNCTNIIVNLRFHFARNTNGTGGQPASVITTIMNNLRAAYNSHGIWFVNAGYDEILNDRYTNWQDEDPCNPRFNEIIQINRVNNAINIYLLEDDDWNQGLAEGVPGIAFVLGGRFNGTPIVTSQIMSHELGHCLNLFHTHHGCESGPDPCTGATANVCLEDPDGSNGATCGDFVADTPADPFIRFNVNGCTWNGTVINACVIPNRTYNPDGNNIMAYVPPGCLNHFSQGQGDRMRTEILRPGSILNAVRSTQTTPYIQDMVYGTQGNGINQTVNTVNFVSANTYYIIRTNNSFNTTNTSWNTNTTINSYVGNGGYVFTLSPGQSVNITVTVSNGCGSSTRTITFTTSSGFRVYPNPASSQFSVEFDHVAMAEALPDQIDLLSEESAKSVRSVNVQDVFRTKAFKEGNKINFDVKELPRGTYYLHIKNSKAEDEERKSIRIILN